MNVKLKSLLFAALPAAALAAQPSYYIDNGVLYSARLNGATAVTIPAGVTEIADYAFSEESSLKSVTIPDSVREIGDSAFEWCSSLREVHIGAGVSDIGELAFHDGETGLKTFTVSSANRNFKVQNGFLLSKDGKDFVACPSAASGRVAVPAGVETLDDTAFYDCDSVTAVTLPATLREIDEMCFAECGSITSFTIPAKVDEVGRNAFRNCKRLGAMDFEGAPPEGLAAAGIPSGLKIRYNSKYAAAWKKAVAACRFTNASSYTPGGSGGGSSWASIKARKLSGIVVDDADESVVGTIQVKVGKPNKKTGIAKVSASVTMFSGKKHTVGSTPVQLDENGDCEASVTVKGLGEGTLSVDGDAFVGWAGGYVFETAEVGGAWEGDAASVYVEADDLSMFPGEVQEDLLPDGETAEVSRGKWKFAKAASIKYKKTRDGDWELQGTDNPAKPNLSGLKLAYTPKTGTFKGSFKVYEIQGTKLKKYTVKVNGIVIDGEGTGTATCKSPALSWPVWVE
ncbi:MAG: leucine-rich repeat domain-containing protein [Kiritimatiellae bacterium]|nr:leucine-rich repeat domain-containing protein [Kiritimatiellia bacterium]